MATIQNRVLDSIGTQSMTAEQVIHEVNRNGWRCSATQVKSALQRLKKIGIVKHHDWHWWIPH